MCFASLNILAYINTLISCYCKLDKQAFPWPCKIVDIKPPYQKTPFIMLEISASGVPGTKTITPVDLVDSGLFEFFSTEDKKVIFQSTYQKEYVSIIGIKHANDTQDDQVMFRNHITGKGFTRSACDAVLDNVLIEHLPKRDIKQVSFLAGENMRIFVEEYRNDVE